MGDLIERSVGAQIELKLELSANLPLAIVDANQIELAVLNLVVNARDAMPDGGTLSVAVDRVDSPGDDDLTAGCYVRLTVADSGHGMDGETLRRATEPFFSTKGLGKGTGLRLSMIHGLAVQLGGAPPLTSAGDQGNAAGLW